jgi:hypothetical protein
VRSRKDNNRNLANLLRGSRPLQFTAPTELAQVGVTCAPKRVSLVTQDGSSLVTNAARQKPALCYQLDYTIYSPELGSVDFTAAAEDNSFLLSGDATAGRKQIAKLASVAMPGAPSEIVVYHFDRAPKADLLTA